jgi:hypothetical protein
MPLSRDPAGLLFGDKNVRPMVNTSEELVGGEDEKKGTLGMGSHIEFVSGQAVC